MSEYDALLEDKPKASEYDALLGDELGPVPQETRPPESIERLPREPIEVVGNPDITADEAFKIGAGQGAFSLGDEISSGIRAVRDTAMSPQRKWEDTLRLYQAYKANAARDRGAAFRQHPIAYMGGALPVAAAMGNVSAALAPAAAVSAAPWGTNVVTNAAQSIANNYGNDTLTPGNVVKDVAMGEAVALPFRIAQHGVRRTIGDIAQLGQRGLDEAAYRFGGKKLGQVLGRDAGEIGDMASKRVKDLRTAQQSYLTDAGKQAAAADAMVSGQDLPSRLAKAGTEGRASLGPNGFSVDPAEFGDEFGRRVAGARSDALRQAPPGMVITSDEHAVTDLMSGIDATRARNRAIPPALPGSPERIAMDSAVGAIKNRFGENMDVSVQGPIDDARSILERWQAAKAQQKAAEAGGEEAAKQLARIKTGRAAIANAAGVASAVTGGGITGALSPAAGMLTGAAGLGLRKQVGQGMIDTVDAAGSVGQWLSAMTPTLQRLATSGGAMGAAAKWVLDGKGAAQIARLATLAKMPEFQDEVAADTR